MPPSSAILLDTVGDGAPSAQRTDDAPEEATSFDIALPRPGDIIGGKYVVESLCRREGIALECMATSIDAPGRMDACVDVRFLPLEWVGNAAVVDQFFRAGRAASTFTSEHAVRAFDVGRTESGAPYFVLEHLTGPRLDEILSERGTVPESTAVDWILQAAEALAEAHARGVVHLDLKPACLTVVRRADGTRCIKVRDFGLSGVADALRGSADHRVVFAPDALAAARYLSPEQLLAPNRSDCRADIWSLGAILHKLISGRAPFEGASVKTVCAAVLDTRPTRLSLLHSHVSPSVERTVLRCLEKAADRRFENLSQFAHALAGSGTPLARASRQRIDATLGFTGAPRATPDAALEATKTSEDTDTDFAETAFRPRASARVVLLALALMATLGAGAFGVLYANVHGLAASPPALSKDPTAR